MLHNKDGFGSFTSPLKPWIFLVSLQGRDFGFKRVKINQGSYFGPYLQQSSNTTTMGTIKWYWVHSMGQDAEAPITDICPSFWHRETCTSMCEGKSWCKLVLREACFGKR